MLDPSMLLPIHVGSQTPTNFASPDPTLSEARDEHAHNIHQQSYPTGLHHRQDAR